MLLSTCPSRCALAGVSGIEADTGGVVEARISEAVVDDELCGRHAAAQVARRQSMTLTLVVVGQSLARADVRRTRITGPDSSGTQVAGGSAALRLEVATWTRKTRLETAA